MKPEQGSIYWYQPLFDLMHNEHNRILVKSEMDDIISVVQQMLSSDTDDERSVATVDDSSNTADKIEKENYEYERGNE